MSVQNYETDVLQEHIDSTPILILRLEQWRKALNIVDQYINGYIAIHQGTTAHLEKTLKNLIDLPTFSEPHEETEAANPSSLGNVFNNLQTTVNVLLQKSTATASGIKTSILPPVVQMTEEIDKHYKALRNQGGKGVKDIEKARETTQRLIEHLGKVTSSFGSRPLSYHEDPYILHRKVEAAVIDQVAKENTQAEAALSVQRSFVTLEQHVMQTVRHALVGLNNLNESYENSERESNATIATLFNKVDLEKEWANFSMANADNLVPSSNYQRDPSLVTFVNKDHTSAKPLMQGLLQRKGTVLKSYNQGYYVLSPSGYLYQFKTAEPTQDITPEMGLYLPECQLSKSTSPGHYVFKIVGKDAQKKITTRHKFVFKANSEQELDSWYNAISRITGDLPPEDDSNDDSAPPSRQASGRQSPLGTTEAAAAGTAGATAGSATGTATSATAGAPGSSPLSSPANTVSGTAHNFTPNTTSATPTPAATAASGGVGGTSNVDATTAAKSAMGTHEAPTQQLAESSLDDESNIWKDAKSDGFNGF